MAAASSLYTSLKSASFVDQVMKQPIHGYGISLTYLLLQCYLNLKGISLILENDWCVIHFCWITRKTIIFFQIYYFFFFNFIMIKLALRCLAVKELNAGLQVMYQPYLWPIDRIAVQ